MKKNEFKIKPTSSGSKVGFKNAKHTNHRYPCPYNSCAREFGDTGNLKNHISVDHEQHMNEPNHIVKKENKAGQVFQTKSRDKMVSLLYKN